MGVEESGGGTMEERCLVEGRSTASPLRHRAVVSLLVFVVVRVHGTVFTRIVPTLTRIHTLHFSLSLSLFRSRTSGVEQPGRHGAQSRGGAARGVGKVRAVVADEAHVPSHPGQLLPAAEDVTPEDGGGKLSCYIPLYSSRTPFIHLYSSSSSRGGLRYV